MTKEKSRSSRKENAAQQRARRQPSSNGRQAGPIHSLLGLQQVVGNTYIARMMAQPDWVQPVVGREGGPLNDALATRLQAQRGGGTSLDPAVREQVEDTFGTSLADIRIHADQEADALARSVNAKAFTIGSDIFFHRNANPSDTRLLTHEITHVIQQRAMSDSGPVTVGPAGDSFERQADQIATEVTRSPSNTGESRHVDVSPAGPGPANAPIQRGLWDLLSAASGPVGLGVSAITGLAQQANRPLAALAGTTTQAMTAVPGAGTLGALGKIASPIGLISGAMDLFGSNKTAGERASGGLGAFSGLMGVAGDIGEFFGTSALSAGGAEGLSAGAGAALGGELGAGAALGSAGAVVGAGLAGYGVGRLLDTGVGAIGQAITGDTHGDYTISGGLASGMTSIDRSVSRLWADPSRPAYTQTLGWKLGEWLGI